MKKFNYFLLIAITILLFTNQVHAFTKASFSSNHIEGIESLTPNDAVKVTFPLNHNLEIKESKICVTDSTATIDSNLKLLYSICFALAFFNLVVQIRIVFQMVDLFFQFKKKDEFSSFSFQ